MSTRRNVQHVFSRSPNLLNTFNALVTCYRQSRLFASSAPALSAASASSLAPVDLVTSFRARCGMCRSGERGLGASPPAAAYPPPLCAASRSRFDSFGGRDDSVSLYGQSRRLSARGISFDAYATCTTHLPASRRGSARRHAELFAQLPARAPAALRRFDSTARRGTIESTIAQADRPNTLSRGAGEDGYLMDTITLADRRRSSDARRRFWLRSHHKKPWPIGVRPRPGRGFIASPRIAPARRLGRARCP